MEKTRLGLISAWAVMLPLWLGACGDDEPAQPMSMSVDAGVQDDAAAAVAEALAAACEAPLLACADGCVDPRFDPDHCGGCDHGCDDGAFCDDGRCVTPAECEPIDDDEGPATDPDGEEQSTGDCCEGRLEGGCATDDVEECVCAVDDFCCSTAWDEVCVAMVTSEGCGSCGGSDPGAECTPSDSADTLPATLSGLLDGSANNVETSCGSVAESEVVLAYTAELAGKYTFDTSGSAITDTVLAALDGSACDGEELACNDDDGERYASRLTLELEAGQTILLVVESWGAEHGAIEVNVSAGSDPEPIDCTPTAIEGALPATVTGTVSDAPSGLSPSCAESSEGEMLYSFTAPAAGRYRFDTTGSTADTILQVLDASCEGEELACNDDSSAGGLAAIVDVELAASQTVIVNLDSYAGEGDYALSVSLASDVIAATGCCVEHESPSCDDAAISACVCADDDYCCNHAWDALCVYAVEDLDCGGC